FRSGHDRCNPAALDVQPHVGSYHHAVVGHYQSRLTPEPAHSSPSRTSARAPAPAAASSSATYPSGECDIPLGLRTNNIADGTWPASTPASWPAPVASTVAPGSIWLIRWLRAASKWTVSL